MTLYKTENGKITETTALVNSGATICCIDLHFVRRMKWPLKKVKRPIEARNADGTSNKGGIIRYQVDLNLRIKERNSLQSFFAMDLGNKNTIILGLLHTLRSPWYSFSFSVLALILRLRANDRCRAVQARLCHKCCGHVIGLGPYLLSMTSSPFALVAVTGFSSFHFCFAPLISAPFAIRRWLPFAQLLFRHWTITVAYSEQQNCSNVIYIWNDW